MRNLLLLFRKFGVTILFLLLEIIAFTLVVNYNNKQRDIFIYSSNLFSGFVLEKYDAGTDYFALKNQNDSIASENARLLGLIYNQEKPDLFQEKPADSTIGQYVFYPASIINKTIKLRNNRFTLNKGTEEGIKSGMGVLSAEGVVGVVQKSNQKYSSVMTLINTQFQLSVKVKSKNFFGDMVWEPYDERFMKLKHIPKHAGIAKGDTIITSGYSTIFPADIPVGTIDMITLPKGSNYFDVRVELFAGIANLDYVYVIENKHRKLLEEIENVN